jgi:serine/threonine protein kinase
MTGTQTNQRPPGEILNTKLRSALNVAKRVGRGRLGLVYAGVHEVLARRFAIKVLAPALTQDENVQRRLRRMIRDASMVDHSAIVSLIDFGQLEDGRFYLVTEFVRGTPLTKALSQEGRFTVERAVPLLIQLAEALEAAHRQRVVHGDVKPNNILIVDQPDGRSLLRLNDFVLCLAMAGAATAEDPLAHLRVYSSFDFLAPEQITAGRVDGRADIYSFGAVAYRMLAGEPPFVGEPEEVLSGHKSREVVPPSRRQGAHEVPPELDAIILRCLEKNPADRWKSMDEVARELHTMAPKPPRQQFEEEEITGRWKLPPELEEQEEPLPESPARLRALFYETMLELGTAALEEGLASPEMQQELAGLNATREEAEAVAAQGALTENRFEDIRRELRERESTLRYAIIDLNLAKSDAKDRQADQDTVHGIEFQIGELERSLAELEQQRAERFAGLNVELQKQREVQKALEQKLAVHYRRLYAHLDEGRAALSSDPARQLYRRLERCRAALAKAAATRQQPDRPATV